MGSVSGKNSVPLPNNMKLAVAVKLLKEQSIALEQAGALIRPGMHHPLIKKVSKFIGDKETEKTLEKLIDEECGLNDGTMEMLMTAPKGKSNDNSLGTSKMPISCISDDDQVCNTSLNRTMGITENTTTKTTTKKPCFN